MNKIKYRYKYSGPVLAFDHLITAKWSGETIAESEKKAIANLAYQFKKQNNVTKSARINLPGQLMNIETIM